MSSVIVYFRCAVATRFTVRTTTTRTPVAGSGAGHTRHGIYCTAAARNTVWPVRNYRAPRSPPPPLITGGGRQRLISAVITSMEKTEKTPLPVGVLGVGTSRALAVWTRNARVYDVVGTRSWTSSRPTHQPERPNGDVQARTRRKVFCYLKF